MHLFLIFIFIFLHNCLISCAECLQTSTHNALFFNFFYSILYSILFKVYNLTQFFFFFYFISLFVHVQITQEVIDLIKPYEQAGDWDGAMKLVRQRDGNKDNKLSTYLSSVYVYFCVCVYSNLIICI